MNACPHCRQPLKKESSSSTELSVVLPVFNEEANIVELFQRVTQTLQSLKTRYEIIFVDDGSNDRSFQILSDLHQNDQSHIQVIRFSRNFGHHQAILAGLEKANGNFAAIMDSDLQDRPEDIPTLYQKAREGYDCVYGIRPKKHHGVFKRLSSRIFWWIIKRLSGYPIPANQSIFRILNRRAYQAILSMQDRYPFLAGMCVWVGFKQTTVPIQHDQRHRGGSKYSVRKMVNLMWAAVTGFSTRPLRFVSYLGILISTFSFAMMICLSFIQLIKGSAVTGWASTIVVIFFLGGIQLVVLGVIGEYLGKTYLQTLNRPRAIIESWLPLIKKDLT